MGIYQTTFFLIFFSIMLLTQYSASTTDRSAISGNGLVQNTRTGHGEGGGSSGGNGNGDGFGESSSSTQPGRPLSGAGTANTHSHHHHKGAAINSPCNLSLLTIVIYLSLCVSMHIWA